MILQVAGHYFGLGSATCVEAVAMVSPDGGQLCITATDGRTLVVAALRVVQASSRLGNLRRKLIFPDGACFETSDNDAVDAMLRGRTGMLHRLEKSWRAVLAAVLLAAATTAWFAFYGVPLAAAYLARHTPASATHFITVQALAALDDRAFRPTRLGAVRQRELQALFGAVALQENRAAGSYRLLLRDSPRIGPNALALPDGSIILTDQLAAMIGGKDEIQGVFAHEMSHVNRAHVLQSVYQAAMVPAIIAFVTGDASQASHFAAILPGVLLQASYSRTFEQQADDDAAILMRAMGENPARLADLLERMDGKMCGGKDCQPSWLGTHPATAERAARLRRETKP